MARFMERFERHLANDPELRAEYERLRPCFRVISDAISARSPANPPVDVCSQRHSGSK